MVDVVGSIDPAYGSYDSQGTIINDPYSTPYATGGFDLDAIGVIHEQGASLAENQLTIRTYPNPFSDRLAIQSTGAFEVTLTDAQGRVVLEASGTDKIEVSTSDLPSGSYFITLRSGFGVGTELLIKR